MREKRMTQARKTIISLSDTTYYHCVSRCVRRAFLCGQDFYSGQDYEHRRQWLEDKLHKVASVFAIKLCSYAVMNNHYHVVLNIRPDIARQWSDREVIERWHCLFSGNALSQLFLSDQTLSINQNKILQSDINKWRARLTDVSWFMRIVNEYIARKANLEDGCTGRFWEGRFKSQALLDEKALLACMAYVDLNPIRTKIAKTPAKSKHTSIKKRIDAIKEDLSIPQAIEKFIGHQSDKIGLPFLLGDYLELIDWTSRMIERNKLGSVDNFMPPILQEFELNQKNWNTLTTEFEIKFKQWVGSENITRQLYRDKKYQRIPSTNHHKTLFG